METALIVALFVVLAVFVVLNRFIEPDPKRAQFMGTQSWHVKDLVVREDLVGLKLIALADRRYIRFVGFASSHPDFQAVKSLYKSAIVRFRYQPKPVYYGRGCARFLRLVQTPDIWRR